MAEFSERFNELASRHPGNDSSLGAALGVSKQTISAWRTGVRSPKKPHIVAIAEYFNVSIPWLMGISDDEINTGLDVIRRGFSPDTPAANKLREIGQALTPPEDELVSIFRALNKTGRQTLLGTARGLAANPDMCKDGASKNTTA